MKSSKLLVDVPFIDPKSLLSSSPTPLSPTPETFKKSQERWDSIASQFGLPLSSELTGLPPAAFPSFPTVKELAASAADAPSSSRPTGLFEELLQSRPEAIYIDTLDHPEKYEEGVGELVRDLVMRSRELTGKERELLNRAVIDLAARPKDKPAPKKKAEPKPSLERLAMEEALDGRDISGPDEAEREATPTKGNDLPAFWWV